MENTLFSGLVDKFFRAVVGKITERYNDKSKEQSLLHKTMLAEEYSADLTWGSTELNHSVVAADVVSLDSSLPLKRRGSLAVASGKLPKLGIKYSKGEKAISDINVMIARGTDEATVASKLFDDASKVIKAIDVRTEIMFLQALSTGQTLVEDADNVGTGIRVDFGYKPEHIFGCTATDWSAPDSTPQDDIQQLFDKANEDGNTIAHVFLSKRYFDFFRRSAQGRTLAATHLNQVVIDPALTPVPGCATFLEALADEYGATFHVVDAAFKVERPDGTTTAVRPWAEESIVGVPAEQVGRLVYGTLAEETNPVAAVDYQKSGSHILVSKYSTTDPLKEFTAGQSLCIPVIDGVDGIYVLHADAPIFEIHEHSDLVEGANNVANTDELQIIVATKGPLADFSATSNVPWATVDSQFMSANGKCGYAVTVTIDDTVDEEATGKVTVSAGNLTKTFILNKAEKVA